MHFIICFFNDTATTEIYTLSLHDALPISCGGQQTAPGRAPCGWLFRKRSEEHTSELQSLRHLVCRLLLEKKKTKACLRHTAPVTVPAPRVRLYLRARRARGKRRARTAGTGSVTCIPRGVYDFFLRSAQPSNFPPFPPAGPLRI